MKNVRLTHLCLVAHDVALERGWRTPAERPEFFHLAMTMEAGTPVLDGWRMRDDQILDAIDVLEEMIGTNYAENTYEAVRNFMYAYGRFGYRWQDIAENIWRSGTGVRRALTKLIGEGMVEFREEKTRGKGSKRKRYFWLGNTLEYDVSPADEDELRAMSDYVLGPDDTGIRYHGTAVQAITCHCQRCGEAFDAWLTAEAVSEARRRGETGFQEGLYARWRLR